MPINQFLIFFLLLIMGFFCRKYGLFSEAAVGGINAFIINISYPCLILLKTATLEMTAGTFGTFMLVVFINLGLLLLFGAYSMLYCRRKGFDSVDRPAVEFAMFASNNGFMGFPVALTFFGDFGLFYMVGANIALNLMFFTYGISLMKRGRGEPGESIWKKIRGLLLMIVNPKISFALIGIVICYFAINMPAVVVEFLDLIGAVATPMAMIAIGTTLAGNFGIRTFKKRAVVETLINKLFIIPLLTFVIVAFIPLDPLAKTILVVSSLMPTATTVAVLCAHYDRDKAIAGEILVTTTLFSMLTVPLFIWVLGVVGF